MATALDFGTRPLGLADKKNIGKKITVKRQGTKKVLDVATPSEKGADKRPSSKRSISRGSALSGRRFEDVVIRCKPLNADITNYLFKAEKKYSVAKGFLNGREVTPKMRSILLDWLVQVHQRFDLCTETLFLTFDLLDRYLSRGQADKTNLQLIGVTCMSLASKYEETQPPKLKDFAHITDGACDNKDIVKMETKVLKVVSFDLGKPTVIQFVRRVTEYFGSRVHAMSKYISETAVSCYELCHLNPSVIAAVSIWIAVQLEALSFASAHYRIARVLKKTVHELVPQFASNLLKMQTNLKLRAVRTKYESPMHLSVSCLTESQTKMLQKLEDASYVATLP